jgi:hypothetical protein
MAAYVLTNKNTKELETTVFASESGDTVAVFTEQGKAQQYLDNAGWQDNMSVAELDDVSFLEWLLLCHRNGIKQMATDPNRKEQESGQRIDTLDIAGQLQHAGESITHVASSDF